MQISRGQRLKLSDLGLAGQPFSIQLELDTGGLVLDTACFGLDGTKHLSDERYMTFYNQPASPCGAVRLAAMTRYDFDLGRLPATIQALTLTLALDSAGEMRQIGRCIAKIMRENECVAEYAFDGTHFAAERAVMLLELYRKDGIWRLSAVGQGFNGGLDALVTHFGGSVAEKPSPASPLPPSLAPAPKVSLAKITLEKRGDKISLEKKGSAGHGRIVCNLNWSSAASPQQKKGLFGGLLGGNSKGGIDLDLGCLFEMADGQKAAVQALGNTFGSYDAPPYIHMSGDDRTGDNTSGEFLYVNGDHLKQLRRICIYAFIYEGAANWGQADGVVTLSVPGHPPIEVRLDHHDNSKIMCAIAMLENDGGNLKVTKLGEYFNGHQDLDKRYGWGLRWARGSK